MMKRLFCVMILCLSFASVWGQNSVVTGCVKDDKANPLPYTSVSLGDGGRVVAGAVTDDDGNFSIKATPGQYELVVQFVGYEKKTVPITVVAGKNKLGVIEMKEAVCTLGEVSVVAQADSKKTTVERTSISADASMSGAKGSVLDLLRTASAVDVAADGTVSVRGNRNVLVLIDGVPTTMTDLSALPSANVKSVDIITNPDARFDAEGTGGIINIVSKKQMATGLSGMVGANYGFNHFVNGNIGLSYNTPKVSWRFNYNTKYEDDLIDGHLYRQFVATGNSINQDIASAKTTFNTNVGVGATFRIDKKNTLGANIKLVIPRVNTKQNFHNTYITDGLPRVENRYSDVSWNRENIDASVNWRHVMVPKKSEYTIQANVSKIWGHRPSFYFLEGDSVNKSNSGGSPLNSSIQSDFKFMFEPGTLETGVKMSFRRNDQFSDFYTRKSGVWVSDEQFSTDLIHQEYVPAAYALFSSKEKGRFSYKAGLRAEYSTVILHSDREHLDKASDDFFLSPTLSGTFRISEKQNLSLAFSRRIGRPTYPQLNPYMSMIDISTFEQGNMNLMPEKSNNADLAYSIKNNSFSLFADLYLVQTSNYITQVSKLSGDGILLLTYINATSDFKSGLDLSLKLYPVKWLDATLSANTFYVNTYGEFEDVDIDNHGWSNSSNLLVNVFPDNNTSIQLQYFIVSPQYYPQFTTAFSHYMNVGAKRTFLHGNLVASVQMTDLLGTYKYEIHSSNKVFNLSNTSWNKSRMLWLGLTYNFNSFKQQKNMQKQESDRSRLNLGL